MPTRFGFFFGFCFFLVGFWVEICQKHGQKREGGLFTSLGRIEVLGIPVELNGRRSNVEDWRAGISFAILFEDWGNLSHHQKLACTGDVGWLEERRGEREEERGRLRGSR